MKSKASILFVSSFLSKTSGSLCVSEKIATKLTQLGFSINLVSRSRNKIVRLLDIVITILTTNAQIIHIDVYSGNAFIIAEVATFIARLQRKNIILTLHGGMLPEFYIGNEQRISKVFSRANLITTPSTMLLQFFDNKGYRIKLIPNAIELDKFYYNRSTVIPNSILWVRAFDSIYNPVIAIQTLAGIINVYPDATLTMIGPDKGVLAECKRLVKKLKIENSVKIVGSVPNNELYKYYQSHSVFLNTTSYESFGVSVLEAAACGIPIVSANVGEIPNIWKDGTDILLCKSENVEDFTRKTIALFENAKFAESLSHHAYQKAQQFNWDKIKPKWIELFKSTSS